MKTSLLGRLAGPFGLFLAALAVVAAPAPSVNAEGLTKFTGYTLPGSLGEPIKTAEGKPVVREEKTGLGVTVLYAVYDRAEGQPGDIWGVGIKGLEEFFVAGKDHTGQVTTRKLDTQARYLYLYQVVHDSNRESLAKTATIRLLVEPQLITSWGHFTQRQGMPEKPGEEVAGQGVGFALEVVDPKVNKGIPTVLPVSTDRPVSMQRKYQDRSPAYPAPKPYSTARILVDNKVKGIADDPTGAAENPGRAPEEVMLLSSAVFEGPPRITQQMSRTVGVGYGAGYGAGYMPGYGVGYMPGGCGVPCGMVASQGFSPFYSLNNPYYAPYAPMASLYAPTQPYLVPRIAYGSAPWTGAPITAVGAVGSATGRPLTGIQGVGGEEDLHRSPAIRAYWLDKPLRPGERSTLFGFTSDYPPTFEDVRVRGNSKLAVGAAVGFGDPDLRPAALTADGELPTPIAYEAAATAPSVGVGVMGGGGTLGGTMGGGGGFAGGGMGLPGFGGGLGGGSQGGGGNQGGGQGQQDQQQQQQQTPDGTPPTPPQPPTVNVNTPVTQTITQDQKQDQNQKLKQKQNGRSSRTDKTPPGKPPECVIPEPAAMVTALLGLPAFLFFLRRRKSAATELPVNKDTASA